MNPYRSAALFVFVYALVIGVYFAVDETPSLVLSRLSQAGALVAGLAVVVYAVLVLVNGRGK